MMYRYVLPAMLAAASPLSEASDTLPLEFIGGIPFVQVKVGAAPPERMMFDSGGMIGISVPQSTIKPSASITVLDEKHRFSDLTGQVHEVPRLRVHDVLLGQTRLAAVTGSVHTPWGGKSADPALAVALNDGVIGLEAMPDHAVMFDYRSGTMSLYPAGDPQAREWKKWRALPLSYGREGPLVMLLVAGQPSKLVLDTGAQANLLDAAKFACAAECPRPRLPALAGADGEALVAQDAERMELGDAPFDGILGAPFFRSYRVVFDVKGRQLRIAPY